MGNQELKRIYIYNHTMVIIIIFFYNCIVIFIIVSIFYYLTLQFGFH